VRTSILIAEAPGSAGCAPRPSSEKVLVHLDRALPNGSDGVRDEGHENPVGELEHGARRAIEDPYDATVAGHGATKEVGSDPFLIAQLFIHEKELAAKSAGILHA
jgi:hypothetical protein